MPRFQSNVSAQPAANSVSLAELLYKRARELQRTGRDDEAEDLERRADTLLRNMTAEHSTRRNVPTAKRQLDNHGRDSDDDHLHAGVDFAVSVDVTIVIHSRYSRPCLCVSLLLCWRSSRVGRVSEASES